MELGLHDNTKHNKLMPYGEDFRSNWLRRPQLRIPQEEPVRPNPAGLPPIQFQPQQEDIQPMPSQADTSTLQGDVYQPTFDQQYQGAQQDYNNELTNPQKKYHPALEALYVGLQGLSKVFNPNDQNPVRKLSDVKEERRLARKGRVLGGLQQQKTFNQDTAYKDAQIQSTLEKPIIAREDLARKTIKDDRDYEMKTLTLNFKKEDRDRYFELEDVKIKAKEKGDERTYDLAVKKQEEIARHNGVTEKQAAINEEGRNSRTTQIIGGQNTRNTQNINARKELQDHAQKYGREKTITDATNNFKTEYLKVNGKSPTAAEIEKFINTAVIPELDFSALDPENLLPENLRP